MENSGYVTTIKGIYRAGRVELSQASLDIPEGTPVLVTFLEITPIDLRARGIGQSKARLLREQLASFAEEWESPEMAAYDDYDSAKAKSQAR
jgi:hypothetical protein